MYTYLIHDDNTIISTQVHVHVHVYTREGKDREKE